MTRKLVVILFFLFSGNLFSQELIPFFDREKKLWGFQNKETRQIVIQPQFEDAVDWWKDYGIVMISGKYGLIDKEGNKASPFIHKYIYVNPFIGSDDGELMALAEYDSVYINGDRPYFINEKCDCIPKAYYPCPPMVKMDTANTTEALRMIQRAEYWYHQGEIKRAVYYADKAIKSDPENSSAYFWKASIIADSYEIPISKNTEEAQLEIDEQKENFIKQQAVYKKELDRRLKTSQSDKITGEEYDNEMKIIRQEDTAFLRYFNKRQKKVDSLAVFQRKWREQGLEYINSKYDTSFHLRNIYNTALKYQSKEEPVYYSVLAAKYELNYLSKQEKKEIKKEIIKNVSRKNRKSGMSVMLNPGIGFFPFQEVEINLTYGYSDFVFSTAFPLMAGAGLGYQRGIGTNIEAYKGIFFLQPIGPIHAAVNFMYVKNAENGGIGFRPEFGFSFSALTVLYGFNFVSNSKFPDVRGNRVGIRVNLPVWRQNEFRKDSGNNIYR